MRIISQTREGNSKMTNQTVNSIVALFNDKGILNRTDYTFVEYVEELMKFQKESAKLVFNQDDVQDIRMNEVVARFEAMAREKKLSNNQDVFEGINALKLINKEIAVAIAGKSGEDRVANMFQYITRPDAFYYRNVYICNEDDLADETELDAVILTKNGMVILEVKTAKEDITIAPDGRILFNNSSCYHDISIGEKMEKKRRLLKKRVEKEFKNAGINKEVVVDSLLVFSTPKNVRIRVHDQFKQENYCFRGSLFNRIDNFGSDTVYTEAELKSICHILGNIETEQKRFDLKFSPDEIKKNFAKAFVILIHDYDTEKTAESKVLNFSEKKIKQDSHKQKELRDKKFQRALLGSTAVAVCASMITLPGLGIASAGLTGGILAKALK